jgi:hypothetical protein
MPGLWEVYLELIALRTAEAALEYAMKRFWQQQRDLARFYAYASEILQDYAAIRPHEYEWSKTKWRYYEIGRDPTFVRPGRDQFLSADVVLLDPEGDTYFIRDLRLPTGMRYDETTFLKRLGAEYNERRQQAGKPPVEMITSKVASYIVDIIWYNVTIEAKVGK